MARPGLTVVIIDSLSTLAHGVFHAAQDVLEAGFVTHVGQRFSAGTALAEAGFCSAAVAARLTGFSGCAAGAAGLLLAGPRLAGPRLAGPRLAGAWKFSLGKFTYFIRLAILALCSGGATGRGPLAGLALRRAGIGGT